MKKKILAGLLCIAMILTMLPMMAFATTNANPIGTWEEAVTEQPAGFAIDTSAKTISISSADGLAWFGKQLNSNANYSGYTITISGSIDMGDHYWIPIDAYKHGKLSNATIKGDSSAEIKNLMIDRAVRNSENKEVYSYYSGFIGQIAGQLTIKDLVFSGAVGVANGSGISVVCGLTYSNLLIENVIVKDSVITGQTKTGAFVGFTGGDGITVTIKNSKVENTTVKGNYSFALMVGLANSGDNVILDNTIAVDSNTEWFSDEDGFVEKGENILNGKYYAINDTNLWLTDPMGAYVEGRSNPSPTVTIGSTSYTIKGDWFISPTAKIGDEIYFSLADAIAAVPTDGTQTTITMIDDESIVGNTGVTIAVGQNVVLDLNGHTISNLVNQNTHSQIINNKGTLTVKDSTDTKADGTGTGLITNVVSEGIKPGDPASGQTYNYTTNLIENNGTITILSGHLKIGDTANKSACYAVDNNSADGTFPICYIKGGLLENNNYTPVRVAPTETNKVVFEMTGGIIKGLYGIVFNTNSKAAPQLDFSIKDGQIQATSYAIYTSGGSSITDETKLNLDLYKGIVGVIGQSSSSLVSFSSNNGNIKFIRGGLFTGDVSSNVKDGYSCAQIGENLYIVGKDAASTGSKLTKGLFNINPVVYVAEGYGVKISEDKEYPYEVYEITQEDPAQEEIVIDNPTITEIGEKVDPEEEKVAEEVLEKVEVTGVADALTEEGQEKIIDKAVKDKSELTQKVVDDALQTQIDVVVEAVAVELKVETAIEVTKKSITFELTPYAVVTAIAENGSTVSSDKVHVENDYLSKNDKNPITVVLGTAFEPQQVLHVKENGVIESFKSGDKASYENRTYKYDEANETVTLQILDFSEVKLLAEKLNEYDVSFDANGGTGTMPTQKIVYGSAFYLPECEFTAPANKKFKSWKIENKEYNPGDKIEAITENTRIKAVWIDTAPDTGDHNNAVLFMALMIMSLLCACGVGTYYAVTEKGIKINVSAIASNVKTLLNKIKNLIK